ncbi:MAG: non-ribosomal peptide synthase/polyketide synthase, partial [Gammaproteobacteria bacterium]|nr:non-ribosomal peptide synthase/polyketide synthase [Gammaproteobacteria bacterium]
PLSAAQQRMWILEQIAPGNDAYHIPWATRLRGTLSVEALQRAVDELLERHESLRTTFRLEAGVPVQHIASPEAAGVRIGQLRVAPAELRSTLTHLSQKPFDFERGPLLRFTVLQLGEREHVLHVVMHHIIGDAWSTTVLRRDLAALYNAAATGTNAQLPDLTVQYADFALWQRDFLNSENGAATLQYWTEHLRDAPAALELPTDWPRPPQLGHAGAWQPMTVPPELTARLQQLSDAHNATLFMVLFAAFNVLLHRYTQQQDIVVGTPVAGRQQSALEHLIGVFINTLPLRTRLQPQQRFSDLLAAVKATALEAFEQQTLAFEQLVEALQPERDTSRAPVFQAMFILQNAPADGSQLHELEQSPVLFDFGSAKLDLTLSMETRDDTLVGYLEYNTELFAAATIERLLEHFLTLLGSIAAAPETAVGELAILPASERQQVLVEWNETALPYPPAATLHSLFAEQVAERPAAIALSCDGTQLSYQELNRRANKLARHLCATGIATETLVAVCTERCPEMVVALLAIHKAGAAYVPVDPEYPQQRVAHMLADSAAPLILTQSHLLARLPDSSATTLCLDRFDWTTVAADDIGPETAAAADNLAYVIYTSGSTGVPKGVEVEHRNAVALAQWARRAFTAEELGGVLASTSICFDLSVFEIFVTLALGGRLILVRDALALPEVDPASDVRLVNTVPSAMAELTRTGHIPASVTTVVLCGEPLSTALVNAIYAFGNVKRVYDLYGPTEDTVYSTWTLRARDAAANIGRPIYNTQAYVLDPCGQPQPIGIPGELFLSGAGVTRGYRGRPELTAERFVPNPFASSDPRTARSYRTGDQVRWRADGTLEFLGRLDQQIKLRGHRIELGEIEAVLGAHAAVDNVAASVRADQTDDPRLVAYLVLGCPAESVAATLAELRDACATALPRYMLPGAYMVLDELPLTPNGKLDRKALPAPAQAEGAAERYVAPRNAVEQALADCWAELLGAVRVGIHDDFFELGGHSLLAIQIASFVRDEFATEVPMMVLFGAPTIAELAAWMAAQHADAVPARIPACGRDEPLPLSFGQQRLWFLAQLAPGDPVYNLPWMIRLSGALDTAALRTACAAVISRHEALRTVFPAVGGEPVQVIQAAAEIEIQESDCRELSASQLRQRLLALARQPLDLEHGPLLQVSLLRTAEEEHVLALVVHHIIYDAWSHTLVMRDLTAAYRAARRGVPAELPNPVIGFADYAKWQRDELSGDALARQLDYWQQQLAGAPRQLALPTDRRRPDVLSSAGATRTRMLDPAVHDQMKALAAAEGASLFMTLLAAFNVLVSRYSGQTDLLVGTPVSGRNRSELEDIVGFFLQTLVIRADLSGQPGFREALARTRSAVLGALEHQDLPFETLVDALRVPRDTSRHPLFQVNFVLQHIDVDWELFEGLSASLVDLPLDAAKFDLTFSVIDADDRLSVRLEYNSTLFDAGTMDRMIEHFETLLLSIAGNPDTPVDQLQLLPDAERAQLDAWNRTAVDYPQEVTLVTLFEQQADHTPDALALITADCELSYRQLNARANQLAHRLIAAGVGPDVRVGVLLERSAELVIALYGIAKAGGAYVPLDPEYPQQRLLYMLEDADPMLVISSGALAGRLPDVTLPLWQLDALESELAEQPETNPPARSEPGNLAYVIFTSGSTGRPKGVMNEHRGICNRLLWMQEEFQLTPADRVLQKTPFSFDVSVWELFWPLQAGATLVLARPGGHRDAGYLAGVIQRHGITTVHFVPSMLQAFLQDRNAVACTSLRRVMCSGEALSVELQNRALGILKADLHNLYGPTEAAIDVIHWHCQPGRSGSGVPLGRPGANVLIYIVEPGGGLAPIGVPGELWIGGVQVARGYINRPELTDQQFVADPFSDAAGARAYRTGDLARIRADGVIEFLGRIDQQIKLRGFRIELQEIEAVLDSLAEVSQSVVMLREDTPGDPRLAAYVIPAAASAESAAAAAAHEALHDTLREALAAQLPDYMVPSHFVVLERFPLTASGKTDRRALPAPERRVEASRYVAPRNEREAQLAALWAELLDVEAVGIHDDFFALGGHSLLATRLVSRMRDALQIEVPLLALFNTPTVAGIAKGLDAAQPQPASAAIVPRSDADDLPLSFAQQRLWFLDQLEGPSPTYSIPLALHLDGAVDIGALQAAVDCLVARHESLRTRFAARDGRPVQTILAHDDIRVAIVNRPGATRAQRQDEATKLAQQPFELAAEPLLRVYLLRADHADSTLLLVMHHIISDGWSLGILARELAEAYAAACAGAAASLPELAVQYADYALWQRDWLTGPELERQLGYWETQLQGAAPLRLLTDYPRPPAQTFRGALLTRTLTPELNAALRALAEREGCTLYMLLLAAYGILLARHAGSDDIIIGSPIAGRQRREIEGLIGFFVNTLPLRLDLSGDPDFVTLLGRVKSVALSAFAHQELPFEKLVEELQPERDTAHPPLVQTLFALQNHLFENLGFGSSEVTPVDLHLGTAKFDLSLFMLEHETGLIAALEYNTDLYAPASIERLHDQLEQLLQSIVAAPHLAIGALPLLSEPARAQLLRDQQPVTRTWPADRVHRLVEASVAQQPEAPAVLWNDTALTYAELNVRANRLARALRAAQVGPGTLVGIAARRGSAQVTSVLAVLKAGAAYLPLDLSYPAARLQFMLDDSGAALVLADAAGRAALPEHVLPSLQLDRFDWEHGDPRNLDDAGGEAAYVIYTSGSTGQPKGVELTHAGLANLIQWQNSQPRLDQPARTLQFAPLSFDVSFQELFTTWAQGGCLVLVDEELRQDLPALARCIAAAGIERLFLPFAALQPLAEHLQIDAHNLRLRDVIVAGEQLQINPAIRGLFRRLGSGARLHNHYGPSETHVVTALTLPDDVAAWPALPPIGHALSNMAAYVLDARQQPVPVGMPGELYIAGVQVATGYRNRPDLNAERFSVDPLTGGRMYRTGDQARLLESGALEYLGRTDAQVKWRGFRIEPGEVEARLLEYPGVRQSAVALRETRGGVPLLVAYVVAEPDTDTSDSALRHWLEAALPDYMVPGVFIGLDSLPVTPSGKLDRAALPPPEDRAPGSGFVAPRNALEAALAELWTEVLGISRVGVHDDFFRLGGHSLLATRLLARVRTALEVELPLLAVFAGPTVAEMGTAVAAARGTVTTPPPVTRPRDAATPLSFAQQRLWFLDQLEPGNPVYNLPWALEVTGPLDIAALQSSFEAIVARHENLRTAFVAVLGKPHQEVRPPLPVPVRQLDARDCGPAELQQRLRELAREPFDLNQPPLLRITVLRTAADRHVVLIVLHHIVADGWSLGVLQREWAALYSARCRNEPARLPELELQYADFAVWQADWLRSPVRDTQLDYWRERLRGAPALLELPTDRPRGSSQTYNGANLEVLLPHSLHAQLRELAQQQRATLYMVCLAAFNVLLARYSGQTDICVGTPVAGRQHSELDPLIGCFLNTLVMRNDLSGSPSFAECIERVKQTALEAFSHQDLPFEQLVEELHPVRDMSHAPLFQVAFVMQNTPWDTATRWHDLDVTACELDFGVAKFDLSLLMAERDDGLLALFEYNSDLFDAATVARLADHFATLLDAAANSPEREAERLPLLTAAERHQCLYEWNATAQPYESQSCLHQLFAAQVARQPKHIALQYHTTALSYAELNHQANQIARWLIAAGAGPGTLVGLCVARSPRLIAALLGILKAGAAYLPLDPEYPAERLQWMLQDSQAPLLVTEQALRAALPEHTARVLCLDNDREELADRPDTDPDTSATAHDLAYVIYTSGSTGQPKGVMIEHRGVCNLVHAQAAAFGLGPGDRMLQFASVSFDASIFEIVMGLGVGATLVLADADELLPGAPLLQVLQRQRVTAVTLPPTALLQLPPAELPELHTITVAGEACPPELVTRWTRADQPRRFFNLYGPTETTVWATCAECRSGEPVTIGRPVSNVRVYVLDRWQEPVPVGVAGELYIGGPGLARGYLNQPALTAERFIADPFVDEPGERIYRTGDRVRWRADGHLEFLGRVDAQVKVRGFRIEPGEVEAALSSHAGVAEAVVAARGSTADSRQLVAYLVLSAGAQPTLAELREHLQRRLPDFMVPQAFVALDALPLTPNRKIDRAALPDPEHQRLTHDVEFVAPGTAQEAILAAIWGAVLQVEQVGIDDNFFELGGDSILSIQIIARAAQHGLRLTPKQVFRHQTVRQLAAAASTDLPVAAEQGPVAGPVPLTPIQRWFAARDVECPEHFNQSQLLVCREELDTSLLEQALQLLAGHHDSLRLQVEQQPGFWRQHQAARVTGHLLRVLDLAELDPAAQERHQLGLANALQADIDLRNGPLLRALLFKRGPETPDRLLLVVHHMAVDWVSWPILLEDLANLYRSLHAGREPALPRKTTSFKAWAERLEQLAAEPELQAETDWWREQPWQRALPVPAMANLGGPGANRGSTACRITRQLTPTETAQLVRELPRTAHARVDEVLLTALAQAVCECSGGSAALLDLEGHGREELFADMDLSRTVGWFTSLYPALLEVPADSSAAAALQSVKTQLRAIPRRGIGYGVLRYLARQPEVRATLQAIPQPQVAFNYLGRFEQLTEADALFQPAAEPRGSESSPRAQRPHPLAVAALIADDQLQITIEYSAELHSADTVAALADAVMARLRELLAVTETQHSALLTATDFPLAGLDPEQLHQLVTAAGDAEDIYQLTALQHGMLYHSLLGGARDVYLARFRWRLSGDLDPALFAAAWQQAARRNPSLRASFAWEGLKTPVQIIHREPALELQTEDWSVLTPALQQQRLEELLAADQLDGFDFAVPPLMRLRLIRLGNADHHFIWTFHHAIIDGWSVPLVLQEVLGCYEALRAGTPFAAPERGAFRDYVGWLAEQDATAAATHWRAYLAGFTTATPVPLAQDLPGAAEPDYAQLVTQLPATRVAALRALAADQRVTLNTLVQGAWGLLLAGFSGADDVVFGATTSGRPADMPGVASMVGLFLNTLPVRVRVAGDQTIAEWLAALQADQLEARQYEFSSLAEVHGWSQVPRGTPLFNSLLAFENYPDMATLWTDSATISIREVEGFDRTNFPLTVNVAVFDTLQMRLVYDQQVLDTAAAERI